jgi:hypothetical protein
MPGFEITIYGATVQEWLDPPRVSPNNFPSRLNPHIGRPMSRLVGLVGNDITIVASINGVIPPDSTLGGRLFVCTSHEAPHPYPLSVTTYPDSSCSPYFKPFMAGHYLISMRRAQSGAVFFHLDIMEPQS